VTAEPLLFLHGYLGQPSMWDDVVRGIDGAHETTLAVLPGHGPSPWTPDEPRFEVVVDAFVERLGLSVPTWLVGYSMGARIALDIALRHPSKTKGALLIGVDPGLRTDDERRARVAWEEERAQAILQDGVEAFARQWERMPLFATQESLPLATRERVRQGRSLHTKSGLAWAMRVLGLGNMPPLWSALAEADVPVRIVTGALDTKFTTIGRDMASCARRAKHEVVAGAGHNVALEMPARVVRELRSALEALPPDR